MKSNTPNFKTEKEWWLKGFERVVGVDEAGRGAMAGPVTVAAVCFDSHHKPIPGINDSKLLSAKKRTQYAAEIKRHALAWCVVITPNTVIDRQGIGQAIYKAMFQAVLELAPTDVVLIDGQVYPNIFREKQITGRAIVNGDKLIYSIACASIIAKTVRDEIMMQMSGNYPQYNWQQNKGYGTKAHLTQMVRHGLSHQHRQSFTFDSAKFMPQ